MTPTASATPLLDRLTPLPAPRRRSRWLPWIIGGLLGVMLDAFAIYFDTLDLLPPWLGVFFAGLFAGVVLHESGHLAAGIFAGFDFYQIVFGPFMISKEARGFKFRFLPRRILYIAGMTMMIPRTTQDLRRGFGLFAAGGPVMTALLFLPILLLPWGWLASSLLVANVVLAFFSWIPMTIGGAHTDGKILRTLRATGPAADRFAAILYVMAVDNLGVEPRAWPREILEPLTADAPGREGREYAGEAAVLLYIHAFDCGDPDAMAAALERVLSNAGRLRPDLLRAYQAEAAFFLGVYRKDAERARSWLADARKTRRAASLPDWDASAMAAVALAEGNPEEAQKQISRAIARLDRQPGAHGGVVSRKRRLIGLAASIAEGAATAGA